MFVVQLCSVEGRVGSFLNTSTAVPLYSGSRFAVRFISFQIKYQQHFVGYSIAQTLLFLFCPSAVFQHKLQGLDEWETIRDTQIKPSVVRALDVSGGNGAAGAASIALEAPPAVTSP